MMDARCSTPGRGCRSISQRMRPALVTCLFRGYGCCVHAILDLAHQMLWKRHFAANVMSSPPLTCPEMFVLR